MWSDVMRGRGWRLVVGPVSGIIQKKKKKKNRGLEFADNSIYSLVLEYQLPHKTGCRIWCACHTADRLLHLTSPGLRVVSKKDRCRANMAHIR